MALAAGTRLGRYEIRSVLGVGGMGEVYLAQDTQLRRPVALKLLPSQFTQNRERLHRFEQEARAAASFNHPNIAHIYEIGAADGTNFITMEYVEGETLHVRIHRKKSDLKKLIEYLVQVANGLAKAHAAGIVHRDLKPENIMVTREGFVKVLDFGLAKLVEAEKPSGAGSREMAEAETAKWSPQSTPGVVMGTIGYMSPEQALGRSGEIDQRSDIFSFGCVLFEATTGRRPFEGDSVVDTLHKIIHAPAPPLRDLNTSVSADLQRIVRRCLAKDPEKRYQSIKDVAIELEEVKQELGSGGEQGHSIQPPENNSGATAISGMGAGVASADRRTASTAEVAEVRATSGAGYIATGIKRYKVAAGIVLVILAAVTGAIYYLNTRRDEVAVDSIAVLPFENKSADPDAEYLSDGLAESLIYRLSQLPNLKVSPRSSVFRYKGQETDPVKAGKELGTGAVLSGRIVQRGDRLTISIELVDVRSDRLVWGEQYDRRMSDLLQTQREIAREITENLKVKVSGGDKRAAKHYTESNEAYQLYLRGRFHWNKRNADALKKSIEYFNQAVEHDPDFALAYVGLADAYILLPFFSAASPQESYPKAKAAAKKAIEIDDTLAEAHTSLALTLLVYDWSLAESDREFRRAIELNPNYAVAHQWYGTHFLTVAGRFDEAIAEGKQAEQLDPLSLIIKTDLGATYIFARQYDKAIEQLQQAIEMDQSFYMARWRLATAYDMKGSFQEAIAEYQKARQLNDDPQVLALLGHAYAASGERDESRKTLDQLKEISKRRYVSAYAFAIVCAGLGEKDQALQWLEQAYRNKDWMMARLKVDPLFDPLRSDPRFAELVRKVGL